MMFDRYDANLSIEFERERERVVLNVINGTDFMISDER